MNTSRRALVRTTALVAPAIVLAGCGVIPNPFASDTTAEQVAATVVSDAGMLANAAANIATNLESVIPETVYTEVENVAKEAAAAASDLNTEMTATAAQPFVTQIEGDLGTIFTDVAADLGNASVSTIVSDVEVLLPVFVQAAGLALSTTIPLSAKLAASAPVSADRVTLARARLGNLPKLKLK